jgi:ABC-type transport system substrate-binding protein
LYIDTLDTQGTPFYDPSIKLPKTDLPAAQKLIDQVVSEQGGKPIEFTFTTYTSQSLLLDSQFLAAQMSRLKNVTVNVESLASTAVIQKFTTGNFQLFPTGLPRWNEPAVDMVNTFMSTSPSNYAKYNSPTVDAALRQLTTEADQKTRVQLVHTIEQQLLKDVPFVFYTRFSSYLTLDKYIRSMANYYDQRTLFDQVWIAKPKS